LARLFFLTVTVKKEGSRGVGGILTETGNRNRNIRNQQLFPNVSRSRNPKEKPITAIYGKNIRSMKPPGRFESLCRYSEIKVSQSISESENGKRPALSRKRAVVLKIWQ